MATNNGKSISMKGRNVRQKAIVYAADDIGEISFTGSLDEFFHSIKDSKRKSLRHASIAVQKAQKTKQVSSYQNP